MANDHKTLVVTLGGQSQVVTFALDALLAKNEIIDQVLVLHLAPENQRVAKALSQLAQEFNGDRYQHANVAMRYRAMPILKGQETLRDINNETDAEAVWQALYALIAELKAQGHTLHLCVAGGRRMLGLMALSAATLHFDHRDRAWHLFTPDELRTHAFEGALRHVPANAGVRLIQVPLSPWGAYFPGLRALVGMSSERVLDVQSSWIENEEQVRCQHVITQLTERQRDVLRQFALGHAPQQVAEALNITLKTVDTHKSVILDLCRNEWQAATGSRLDYHFLRDKFRDRFQ